MMIGVQSDDRLQQRRSHLVSERDEADLSEVEVEGSS